MRAKFYRHLEQQLQTLREQGLYKPEQPLASPQHTSIQIGARQLINLCANNYLGLANHPALIAAAKEGLDHRGFGMASVRFICGTQQEHGVLEQRLADFFGLPACQLYSSCFDANGGLFEALLDEQDAVISDALNHASIIDGIRLCKARRYRYANNDMADLERQLRQAVADGSRFRLIATDGVFSMDGVIAPLAAICALADRYEALVMVDDSHGVGVLGASGRGSPELAGVMQRLDILTGTLGKALGGASGGYVVGQLPLIALLRQRARPYLFSNALAPPMVAASLQALALVEKSAGLRARLQAHCDYFRGRLQAAGFRLAGRGHPIIPILVGEARLAGEMARRLLQDGIFVVSFSYPVVPQGQARIRTQLSAVHERAQLDQAIAAFIRVGRELRLIEHGGHGSA